MSTMPRVNTTRNERLYRARVDAGLTQAELALVTGMSRQRINQYELLKNRPAPKDAQKIAYVLSLHTGQKLRASELFAA